MSHVGYTFPSQGICIIKLRNGKKKLENSKIEKTIVKYLGPWACQADDEVRPAAIGILLPCSCHAVSSKEAQEAAAQEGESPVHPA
jgi:hypothetical protein